MSKGEKLSREEREQLFEAAKQQMSKQRYEHTQRVYETALDLAELYDADLKKTEIAAILHDYAKFRRIDEMEQIISEDPNSPKDVLTSNKELWHAFAGAVLVEREVGITDVEILAAIRYHTTGRKGMSVLEKVIWLADYIEPGRSFPGVIEVREQAKTNLDKALLMGLKNTILFLEQRNTGIHSLTHEAYADLSSKIQI